MRNYKIDSIRFFAALGVVLIHVTAFLPTEGGASLINYYWYRPILDLGVPFFFAVSGYILSEKSTNYIKKYSKNIFKMYITYSLMYIIIDMCFIIIDRIAKETPFWNRVEALLGNLTVINFIDGTFGRYHLWFLMALFISGLILYYLAYLNLKPKTILLLSTIFYFISMSDISIINEFVSYGGFPKGLFYLSMGFYLGKKNIKSKKSLFYSLVFILLYGSLSIIVRSSIINMLMAPSIFFLIIFINDHPGKETVFSTLGKHSLNIYILHVFVIEFYYYLIGYFPQVEINNNLLKVVILFGMSTLIPIILINPIKKVFINPVSNIIDHIINIEKYSNEKQI